jgi:hypothetical protein
MIVCRDVQIRGNTSFFLDRKEESFSFAASHGMPVAIVAGGWVLIVEVVNFRGYSRCLSGVRLKMLDIGDHALSKPLKSRLSSIYPSADLLGLSFQPS